jgi:FlaA1/EpsC-like NDP-sugar epimerase
VPADIEFVGLRPGEKLHESLVHEHETLTPTSREKILRVNTIDAPENVYDDDIREFDQLAEAADVVGLALAVKRLEKRVIAHDQP